MRRRLDLELVRRGLAVSRERAQSDIAAGRVLVAGAVADKPARLVAPGEPLELVGPPPRFVSRGGEKLDAALDRFAIPVVGRTALDAGASTGGFTDCLLQRGAASVIALDVGHGHLDLRLRQDRRVTVRERTNVRHLRLDEPVDLVVADLSFISLRTVATALREAVRPGPAGDLVVLIKPQFEAGRVEVSRGKGVVRDPATWAGAIEGVHTAFAAAGAAMMGLMVSPLLGAEGNVE
ncbi:MAG TPA: TlyA family RNA methyltransferase, partial [Acidimicrobiales bacterium]